MQQSKILECISRPFLPLLMMDHFLPTALNWMIKVTLNLSYFCIIYEPDTEQPSRKVGQTKNPLKLEEAELVLLKAELAINFMDLMP